MYMLFLPQSRYSNDSMKGVYTTKVTANTGKRFAVVGPLIVNVTKLLCPSFMHSPSEEQIKMLAQKIPEEAKREQQKRAE